MRKILRADAVGVLGLALLLWAVAPDAPVADSAMRGSKRETGGLPTTAHGREVKGCTRNFAHDDSSLASSRFV